MARVRPFRAWRYAAAGPDITPLVAPPYDVISAEKRAELVSRDPHNVVRLELPDGALDPIAADNRYYTGAKTWNAWREEVVLAKDNAPAVYVLEQRFELHGCPVRRRALIVEVALEPFDAGVVLRHERVLPKALGDRFELLKATHANFSQVFGLFEDAAGQTDAIFSEASGNHDPIATATDDDGVESVLWMLREPHAIEAVTSALAGKQIFIADGHHRYTTALAYRDLRRELAEAGEEHPADPDYDFVMMALVNMDDPDLAVLPYHRIADAAETFDASSFKAGLSAHFDLSEVAPDDVSGALEGHERPAFLIKTRADDEPVLAVLRDNVDLETAIQLDHSATWKGLDVAVLQELILSPFLGIHPDRPETLERLSFTKDADAAFDATRDHDVAFVLRATRLDQLRDVSLGGEIMPQKSTYFYPKLLSGLLFRGMEE